MTDAPPPATLADLLAWRPPPGCRLVLCREHDGTLFAAVDACCATVPLSPFRGRAAADVRHELDDRAAVALILRHRRHAAHPDACRGDVLTALAARGAEAVGAGDGRPTS